MEVQAKKWRVMVCPCYSTRKGWQIDGTQLVATEFQENHYTNLESCLALGQLLAKGGVAVTVRPMFNDLMNDRGEVIGFREWRSFGGEVLQEVKFPDFKHKGEVEQD